MKIQAVWGTCKNEEQRTTGHVRIYESKTEAENWQMISRGEGKPKAGVCVLDAHSVSALTIGLEWNKRHEASYLLSNHHLHRPIDDMKLPKLLRLPKIHRRTRSKARNETGLIEDQSEADLVVPRPTEPTPDLRIGTSTLPTPSPLTPHDQESNSA